ncbi:hypothetical protein D3C75_771210 [compost metagenome]
MAAFFPVNRMIAVVKTNRQGAYQDPRIAAPVGLTHRKNQLLRRKRNQASEKSAGEVDDKIYFEFERTWPKGQVLFT